MVLNIILPLENCLFQLSPPASNGTACCCFFSFFFFLYRRSSAIILLVFHSRPVLDHWVTLYGGVYTMSIFVGAAYRIRTHAGATQTTNNDALTTSATTTPKLAWIIIHFFFTFFHFFMICICFIFRGLSSVSLCYLPIIPWNAIQDRGETFQVVFPELIILWDRIILFIFCSYPYICIILPM